MKKWMKITLILAVILILLGGIMTMICVALGATWDDVSAETEDEKKIWSLEGEEIHSVHLEVDAGEMKIQRGDHYQVQVENAREGMRCEVKNGVLTVEEGESSKGFSIHLWNLHIGSGGVTAAHPVITVTVPYDAVWKEADFLVGAGSIKTDRVMAENVTVSVAAGSFRCQKLNAAGNGGIDVDAGSAEISSGSCAGRLKVEVNAGSAVFRDFTGRETDFLANAGSVEYAGTLAGNWTADCAVGSVELSLMADEQDYNYWVDCDMGSVSVGGRKFSGMSDSQEIRNGSMYTGRIECSIGSVEVHFDK